MAYNLKHGNGVVPFRKLGSSPLNDKDPHTGMNPPHKNHGDEAPTTSISSEWIQKEKNIKQNITPQFTHATDYYWPHLNTKSQLSKEAVKEIEFQNWQSQKYKNMDKIVQGGRDRYVPPNSFWMIAASPGATAAYQSGNKEAVQDYLSFHNTIINTVSPISKVKLGGLGKPIVSKINPLINYTLKNPRKTAAIGTYIVGNKIYDAVESDTEQKQTQKSVDYGDVIDENKDEITSANVTKAFEKFGWNRGDMEREQLKFYSDFKKNNPTLKDHPSTYLSDKSSEHYSAEYSYLQNRINRAYESGEVDTLKAYPEVGIR
jgi:hypothetical protein